MQKEFDIPNLDALQSLTKTLFDTFLNDAVDAASCNSKYEMYTDIVVGLRNHLPTFATIGDESPQTFARIFVNLVQDTFIDVAATLTMEEANTADLSEELAHLLFALVSLVGRLCVRGWLGCRVPAQIMHDVVGIKDRLPKKASVYAMCEMMHIVGKTLDGNQKGNVLMTQFTARLVNVGSALQRATGEAVYPPEVGATIESVTDARFQQWPIRDGSQVLLQLH